jgi:pimeloyl-ACP methyl ester carboxylesterase
VTIFLSHSKTKLALHTLRESDGQPLLLLHGLGERSPRTPGPELASWRGPIYALDFTGHGESSVPGGGGYTAETLMADADAALAVIGPLTLLGKGLGAYVALLLAGARARQIHGAILCDGPGLAGGGDHPGPVIVRGVPERQSAPDPFALVELASDLRPSEYAVGFVGLANQLSGLTEPLTVCAKARPDWLKAVLEQPGVVTGSIEDALQRYGER